MGTNCAQVQILNPAISSGKYGPINKLAPVVKTLYKFCVNVDIGQPMQIRTGGCVLSCGYNYPLLPLASLNEKATSHKEEHICAMPNLFLEKGLLQRK